MARMTARTMVAGGVAGLGLAIGGVAVATADDTETPAPPGQEQPDDRGFGEHRGGPWAGPLAGELAEELGISEEQVREAWDAVRDDVLPDLRDRDDGDEQDFGPPTEAEIDEFQGALAAALAEELGLPVERVERAIVAVRADLEQRFEDRAEEWRTDARERLVERLDEAVEDGDLTAADKTSVLKAFDAGVLGGGPGPFGFGGFGGHGPR